MLTRLSTPGLCTQFFGQKEFLVLKSNFYTRFTSVLSLAEETSALSRRQSGQFAARVTGLCTWHQLIIDTRVQRFFLGLGLMCTLRQIACSVPDFPALCSDLISQL